LISGPSINALLSNRENRLSSLLASGVSNEKIVETLYWNALTRPPRQAELSRVLSTLQSASDRRLALEELAWALLNSKEFVLRR
jgi:hypothetical protein